MSRPIYKVTSKKTTELLIKELKRKHRFIRGLKKKAQKVMPEIAEVTYVEDPWDGSVRPKAVIFKEDAKIDFSKWKTRDKVLFGKDWVNSYWPKINTLKGKQLSEDLKKALPKETFFQGEELSKTLKYDPKSKTSEVNAGRLTVNTLAFGFKKIKKDYTFFFAGYKGYEAPRGVKEMLNSEYNKMMEG